MTKQRKFAVRKFNGDDMYSWAVFRAADVKGKGSPIFYGEAKPMACGLSRTEARAVCTQYEREES